jgi:hypothetical protein
LTIQVEDDEAYVPEEIAELADEAQALLSETGRDLLAQCDTRLDIMSTSPPKRMETPQGVGIVAQTDLDPQHPDVERVLLVLGQVTGGFVVDCVNGRLRAPGAGEWVEL